jgi:hypothetical protein
VLLQELLRSACLALLVAQLIGCRSAPVAQSSRTRYATTTAAIAVGLGTLKLCIAIDPADPHGVWWWEPGATGCTTRSTGPWVFRGDEASVAQSPGKPITASFRLPTHSESRPFITVRLTMSNDAMMSLDTGAEVSVQRRGDLDIPEMAPRARQ